MPRCACASEQHDLLRLRARQRVPPESQTLQMPKEGQEADVVGREAGAEKDKATKKEEEGD